MLVRQQGLPTRELQLQLCSLRHYASSYISSKGSSRCRGSAYSVVVVHLIGSCKSIANTCRAMKNAPLGGAFIKSLCGWSVFGATSRTTCEAVRLSHPNLLHPLACERSCPHSELMDESSDLCASVRGYVQTNPQYERL